MPSAPQMPPPTHRFRLDKAEVAGSSPASPITNALQTRWFWYAFSRWVGCVPLVRISVSERRVRGRRGRVASRTGQVSVSRNE